MRNIEFSIENKIIELHFLLSLIAINYSAIAKVNTGNILVSSYLNWEEQFSKLLEKDEKYS
uniref:Uncharacterized protein n=1 Tax=viral metagenome TaxID=1070528 RepID=A0A6M3M7J3_9ZZZZ